MNFVFGSLCQGSIIRAHLLSLWIKMRIIQLKPQFLEFIANGETFICHFPSPLNLILDQWTVRKWTWQKHPVHTRLSFSVLYWLVLTVQLALQTKGLECLRLYFCAIDNAEGFLTIWWHVFMMLSRCGHMLNWPRFCTYDQSKHWTLHRLPAQSM